MTTEWNRTLPTDGGHLWQWGPRALWAEVTPHSVSVATSWDLETPRFGIEHPLPEPIGETTRFVRPEGSVVRLSARTADRSIIARPAQPLVILGRASTPIYVSSPLWAGFAIDSDTPFFEEPTQRLNSTWSGATPQAGQLAYAIRTRARVRFGQVESMPGRTLTRIQLVNTLPEPWIIERIEVPLPHLALFRSEVAVWTGGLRIDRTGDSDVVPTLEGDPPPEAGVCTHLAEPRLRDAPRLSLRALSPWSWQ